MCVIDIKLRVNLNTVSFLWYFF